jgi:osmotically-inducible protein OsmY
MRRFFLAATILSIVAGGPLQAHAGDREIAEQIIQKLKVQRDAGALKDFTLDLKVDKGVVLMRGNVREEAQKKNVLAVAKDIEGIANVVDEITVAATSMPTATATVVKPKAPVAVAAAPTTVKPQAASSAGNNGFSFKQALAASKQNAPVQPVATQAAPIQAEVSKPVAPYASPIVDNAVAQASKPATWQPSAVEMAGAVESSVESDREITSSIVSALGAAQRQGRLKGFGVDVNTQDGRVFLNGRASSDAHRELITGIARQVPGVVDVVDEIAVYNSAGPMPTPMSEGEMAEPAPLADFAPNLTPVNVEPMSKSGRPGTPAMAVSQRTAVPAQAVPYQMQPGQPMQATPVGMSGYGGAVGAPVPMAPYAGGAAAPRYEQPYLPNYAWPGYAAYPNYAAVSYPQQYSPSAWPYIGPFYPYPQVPLGWRKVSLEWDDGWWMLDFTDR